MYMHVYMYSVHVVLLSLTVQMGKVVNVCHKVVWFITVALETQLKYLECNVFVLANVVLHKSSCHKHLDDNNNDTVSERE